MEDQIKIPFSKSKISLLFFGAIIFVLLGILFISKPEKFINIVYRNPDIIRIVGVISLSFFGICAIFIFKKLFDKKSGLVIDQNGITVNSNATSVGLIKWSDITQIKEAKEFSQKFIIIEVSNPNEYIESQKNKFAQLAMKANYKKYGSPISITPNSLKIDFKKLKLLIEENFKKQIR